MNDYSFRNQVLVVSSFLLLSVLVHTSTIAAQEKVIGIVKTVKDHAFIMKDEKRVTYHAYQESAQNVTGGASKHATTA